MNKSPKNNFKNAEPTHSVIANGVSHRWKSKERVLNLTVHVAMAITMMRYL